LSCSAFSFHEVANASFDSRKLIVQNRWPEPAWIAELPEEDRGLARVRYYLNLAAIWHSESGLLTSLSQALDLNKAHLNVARKRGKVSPELAVRIESALGREHFPRELFNDIFTVAER
jgi:hypothetical protein